MASDTEDLFGRLRHMAKSGTVFESEAHAEAMLHKRVKRSEDIVLITRDGGDIALSFLIRSKGPAGEKMALVESLLQGVLTRIRRAKGV